MTDRQVAMTDRQGAMTDRQGVMTDRQGAMTDRQGVPTAWPTCYCLAYMLLPGLPATAWPTCYCLAYLLLPPPCYCLTYLLHVHGLWCHVEGGAPVVVGHMRAVRIQQLTQTEICRMAGRGCRGSRVQQLTQPETCRKYINNPQPRPFLFVM